MDYNPYNQIPDYRRFESEPPIPEQPPFDARSARKIFSRVGFAFALMFVLYFVGQIALIAAISYYTYEIGYTPEWLSATSTFFLLLPYYLVGVPFCALVLNGLPKDERLSSRQLPKGMLFPVFTMNVAGMVIGSIIAAFLMAAINAILPSPAGNMVAELLLGSNVWLTIIFVCIITPIMEELAFRKLLLDRIAVFGDKTAILISGLMFGLFHGNLYQFFYAFIFGVILAWVYLRSGKLSLPVIFHGIVNFMGGVIAPFFANNADAAAMENLNMETLANMDPKVIATTVASGIYGLVYMGLAIAGVVLFFVYRSRLVTEKGYITIPKGKGFRTAILNSGMMVFLIICLGMFAMSLIA